MGTTYRPLVIKYLSRTRTYTYKGIRLEIPPEVFHPGLFFSTKLLLRYLAKENLSKKSFLELGAGSGLLSIYAAQRGALATATDINPVAMDCIHTNAHDNGADIVTIRSDVFDDIPKQRFDFMVINPPYYKKKPASFAEYAWYCGENGEYFQKFFGELDNYLHEHSVAIMVLCDGCDLEMIKNMARKNSFALSCVQTQSTIIEKNFIFKIERQE